MYRIALGTVVMLAALSVIAQPADQISAQSVVKVRCGGLNSTGFVWQKRSYVVTALHGVAGCSPLSVYSEHLKKERTGKIQAVLLKADLALLKIEGSDFGLKPLKHAKSLPDLGVRHVVWGYPRAIPSMHSINIDFARSLKTLKTGLPKLGESFFKSQKDFKKQVGKQGFPTWDTQILKIGSTIQYGQSGAPIFDAKGRVVAIADGGLYKGVAGINWSIPASIYLPKLEKSSDKIPKVAAKNASLMSSVPETSASVEFDYTKGNKGTLELVFSVPLSEIEDLIPEEDREDAAEILESAFMAVKGAGLTPENTMLNIYQDYLTGATIAIPQEFAIEWEANKKMVQATSADESIAMLISIQATESWGAAKEVAERFVNEVITARDWEVVENESDDPEPDEQNEEAFSYVKLVERKDEEIIAEGFAFLMIEGGDVLGVTHLQSKLMSETSQPEFERLNALAFLCLALSAFAEH